jgi:hypothetical protein
VKASCPEPSCRCYNFDLAAAATTDPAAAAADEKSTFERLMAGYSVNKQPLLQPRRLTTLTPMDQQVGLT